MSTKQEAAAPSSTRSPFGTGGTSMDRRKFMTRLAGTAAVGALATGVDTKAARADDTPKKGGNLKVAIDGASTSDSLDPLKIAGNFIPFVVLQLHNTLADVDQNNRLIPQLAESWTPGPSAKEWVFKIRRGVTFHNGKTLTAADVVYSLNRHRGKDSTSPVKVYLAAVTDIKATDPYELTVTLDSGDADFPYTMTDYHLCIIPEGGDPSAGMGTGAFVIDKFQPGIRTLTKRNPNYWRSDRGFVDSVETLAINDPVARSSAFLSGTVHLMNKVDPSAAGLVESNSSLQLFNAASASHCLFPMRCDTAPFTDNNVRLALKYAINRDRLVKTVLRGYGTAGNDQPIPTFDPFYAADIPQRPCDPDKARFHMKQAGFNGTIALHVSDSAFTGAVTSAQLFQDDAQKAGIRIEVVREPADGYWDNVWMKQGFCASNWSGRLTANLMFSIAYKSDASWNETFWKRPDFDKILIAARAELDEQKRRQMYHDLQMMVHEDGGELIPMFNNYLDGGSHGLKGFRPMHTFELSGYRAAEQVWLEG